MCVQINIFENMMKYFYTDSNIYIMIHLQIYKIQIQIKIYFNIDSKYSNKYVIIRIK